jgi:ribosome-binding protein aMBF1 (putative translation factor)
MAARSNSPVGTTVSEARRRRARKSAAYRVEQKRVAPFEALARIVIKHRLELGITQQELAARMGTSHSAISRIESGRHRTSLETLRRLGDALDVRFVIGFESGPTERPVRELITV